MKAIANVGFGVWLTFTECPSLCEICDSATECIQCVEHAYPSADGCVCEESYLKNIDKEGVATCISTSSCASDSMFIKAENLKYALFDYTLGSGPYFYKNIIEHNWPGCEIECWYEPTSAWLISLFDTTSGSFTVDIAD